MPLADVIKTLLKTKNHSFLSLRLWYMREPEYNTHSQNSLYNISRATLNSHGIRVLIKAQKHEGCSQFSCKMLNLRVEETAQPSKAISALPEAPGSVPRTHTLWFTTACNSSSRASEALFWSP